MVSACGIYDHLACRNPGHLGCGKNMAPTCGCKLQLAMGRRLAIGIQGKDQKVDSKLYGVNVRDQKGLLRTFMCYGLEKICSTEAPPDKDSYAELCEEFSIDSYKMKKPSKIDILVSMRQSVDHPNRIRSIGDMTLYGGPFGLVFGGTSPKIRFSPHVISYPLSVVEVNEDVIDIVKTNTVRAFVKSVSLVGSKKAEKDFLEYFELEKVGVDCAVKCGGCQCGQCLIGKTAMSIKDEREYNKIKEQMEYDPIGTPEDPGPYWKTNLPFNVDRKELKSNFPAVLGVMNATKRKLSKNESWENTYEAQLRDLIDRGVAREISTEELENWKRDGKPHYYTAHQMVVQPASQSTPIRVVFNSSQLCRGTSLNKSLDLGPDILSNLHGVLLRFRADEVAGQGDISKMFYSVRIKLEDQMMQLFVWKWKGEDRIRTFAMCRLIMGNKPSTAQSGIGLRETAKLKDYEMKYPIAYKALWENTYVDNTLHTEPNTEKMAEAINQIEYVAAKGGFFYKAWTVSGQNVTQQLIRSCISQSGTVEEEKTLGAFWDVKEDKLFIKAKIEGPDKTVKQDSDCFKSVNTVISQVKPRLTLRTALSIHCKSFDPLGFCLPTKMIGALLFRRTIQNMKKESQGKIQWDLEVPMELAEEWSDYFEMLRYLDTVKFPRSFKPSNVRENVDPDLITFGHGNPKAYGVVAYIRWLLKDGNYASRLIMARAMLAALLQLGETVTHELCSALYQARLKSWIMEHSGIKFGCHIPILDSMIVKDMILKESYKYNTFAGLRIGEIQKKTDRYSWLHVPSAENVSDCLTKGVPPNMLGPDSDWQNGPKWLSLDKSQWPISQHVNAKDSEIEKFLVKTKTKAAKVTVEKVSEEFFGGLVDLDNIIERSSSLIKLIRSVALFLRLILCGGESPVTLDNQIKSEFSPSANGTKRYLTEITASEYNEAWLVLIAFDQSKRLEMKSVLRLSAVKVNVKLQNYPNIKLTHTVLGKRVKHFPVGFSKSENIPIIPYSKFGKLVVHYYHNIYHREVDTIVGHVRQDVWVIGIRRIAANIQHKCLICIERRKFVAGQAMGSLPEARSSDLMPAWSAVNMDLFGPILIRDECIKKGPRVTKAVWGVLFCCSATRGVYLDIASDYSTESVLHTVRRLLSLKGETRLIISDPGSQLEGASKELSNWRYGWKKEELIRFGASRKLEWKFIMPASQHQNGAAEVMVKYCKGVKKALMKSLGDRKLTYNEMHTLMCEVANICNERPIGVKPLESEDTQYLSPNSLYLGRCSDRISAGPFQPDGIFTDDPENVKSRFLLVQAITAQFWRRWIQVYFPTLLIRQKWHVNKRNVKVGDVCLLKDSNTLRGDWRLVKISEIYPDEQGIVRNVEVTAPRKQDSSLPYKFSQPIKLNRHVNNLVVLVPNEEENDKI